jgi:tRNA threonylcarbamoyladenosine biosynthesis protein TsaB
VLAIDTSTQALCVALAHAKAGSGLPVVHAHHEEGGAQASLRLLPAIESLLNQAGVTLAELKAIGFGRGPGAFTGVRTAASVAQGLALGLHKPLLALDSLLIVAEAAYHRKRTDPEVIPARAVWHVAMDARMNQLYVADYVADPVAVQAGHGVVPWRELRAAQLVDEGLDVLEPTDGMQRIACEPPSGDERSQALGRIAVAAYLQGHAQDAALAQPVYVRNRVALTQAERDAKPKLRPMTLAHVDEVLRLEQTSYPFPWTRGNFVDSLAASHWAQVLHDDPQRIKAYVVAMPGVQEMHLLNVTVHADHRRKGLATALVHALCDEARRQGALTLWLEVRPSNQEGLALYTRLGFVQQGQRKGYYPAARGSREDALVMSLDLRASTQRAEASHAA